MPHTQNFGQAPDSAPHYLNRLEPLTLLSALAVSTSRIGLVGTLTTSYNEPFNVARAFASLDLISGGRAGWNVVTTGLEGAAGNYGREEHIPHPVRYRRAREHLQVVRALWDSYEDDAFPRDKASGIFLDKTRQHRLDHKGEFFSVAGPLNISRSRQGHPVIFQAGASDDGRQLAASAADAVFAGAETFEEAQEYYGDVKGRAAALGRQPEHLQILLGASPIIAGTDEDARRIEQQRRGKIDLDKALVQLGRPFNYYDFSRHALDEPFPDLGDRGSNGYRSAAERIKKIARDERLTLRQAAERFTTRRTPFVGAAETVANEIERWFKEGALDGLNLHLGASEGSGSALLISEVVPLLQRRGLFRTEYEGSTLRGHLGLAVPQNRYTAARQPTLTA
ncbi:NtaA/DmoA family FMN-dependent monooxygenase [Xylophilus sp.]|uniref:NtaA/DmoA family FMN-dependent monooxygenase n=1 Tax=Xylophilus sp. TaxID=2653893 RepID=UPI0013B78B01|nr:NtaA/DmoA family FMN-dependent monooxygenase [Xylophilus sp.]KAF1042976.1 MAG: putative monooxygenase MoxC [Xylophilus sp.]